MTPLSRSLARALLAGALSSAASGRGERPLRRSAHSALAALPQPKAIGPCPCG